MALPRYDDNAGGWVPRPHTDHEARQYARDYRGIGGSAAWYRSPKWRAMTSIADGVTTVHDVADAMARGDTSPQLERLAADYWLMAGHHVNTAVLMAVRDARWSAAACHGADEDGYCAGCAAVVAEAEARASEMWVIVAGLADACHEAWSAEIDKVCTVLASWGFDAEIELDAEIDELDAELEGGGQPEDSYRAHLRRAAEDYVVRMGYTAADLAAQWATAPAAVQEAPGGDAGVTGTGLTAPSPEPGHVTAPPAAARVSRGGRASGKPHGAGDAAH